MDDFDQAARDLEAALAECEPHLPAVFYPLVCVSEDMPRTEANQD